MAAKGTQVPATQRVFATVEAARVAQAAGTFPPASNALGAVFADPAKLETALKLAKEGKPIGYCVDVGAGWWVSDVMRSLYGVRGEVIDKAAAITEQLAAANKSKEEAERSAADLKAQLEAANARMKELEAAAVKTKTGGRS